MIDFSAQELGLIGALMLVFTGLGILSAIQAVLTARTSQGAIAWVVCLLTLPYLAVPAYWILGRNRFHGYVTARRQRIDGVFSVLAELRPKVQPYMDDIGSKFGEARAVEKLARMRFLSGNRVGLLVDGNETFEAIFEAIEKAENYVLVEFFIINDDELGKRLKDCLIRRSKAGVDVSVLYDNIGSAHMTRRYVRDLTEAGVAVTGMNTTRGRWNRFQLNFRNHRKIVIVDGKVGFIGGHNVGDEYLGLDRRLTPWRDTHMSIEGPAVIAAQLAFVEDWHWATEQMPDIDWEPVAAQEGDQTVFVLPSGPADEYETCGFFFTHAINSASERIWIATPYFVPDEGIMTALMLAAFRGVDVRVIIPGLADKAFIKMAAMAYVEEAVRAGVKIFEYGDGFMHQKVMLLDDQVSVIGTANFDNRSFRLNFEVSVLTIDPDFSVDVKEMLKRDFEKSTEITEEQLASRTTIQRVGSSFARLFAPIL